MTPRAAAVTDLGPDYGPGRVTGWELVDAAAGGDREAFGRIYEHHAGAVFAFVVARLGDRALAEDITAETFLRALRAIATVTYQGRGIRAWLITIARNLIRDYVKSSRHRLDSSVADVPESAVVVDGPEHVVISRETAAELRRAVDGLSPAQRECVVLRFWVSLSVAETAAVLNRTTPAVKGLQHRAVRRLAHLLPQL